MEAVVFEHSPLAGYLDGKGGDDSDENAALKAEAPDPPKSSFAPRGRPTIRSKFRNNLPAPLRLVVPQANPVSAIHNTCSNAVNSRLGRVDNARFLERFRYIIVASQLLNVHGLLGHSGHGSSWDIPAAPESESHLGAFTLAGASGTAAFAFALVWLINWTRRGTSPFRVIGRIFVLFAITLTMAFVAYANMRRHWLKYLRQQSVTEISAFVTASHQLDSAVITALTLVQEVELVSRGYRMSVCLLPMPLETSLIPSRSIPLPPISRLEDRSQTRRCARLRKQLSLCLAQAMVRYNSTSSLLRPFTEEIDLERYFDIYDINDSDFRDAMTGYPDNESDDLESIQSLKILAARFHIARKILLCCLMALDAHGGKSDFLRWNTAVEQLGEVTLITSEAEKRLRRILDEEENFPVPPTPKIPLTPGRERWRAQLRKLNSLSSGIRGLQAKLHVLREESDKNLNEADEVSEMGTNLMIQYESIGIDLRALMQEWEDGKAALASNIDRNERRVSSMSGILSPTTSLGGLTAVDEGNALDALKALNGESRSRSSMDFSSSDAEEIFEAVAIPRQRSTLSREERIAKMRGDRVKRESIKLKSEANTTMLRELESVINMRPRGRTTPAGRITSI